MGHMERFCIDCQYFRDGAMHRAYVTPRCTYRGDDAAMYMRQYVCGLEGDLWEPMPSPAHTVADGSVPEPAI